jgi:general secretion pathway protein A
LFFAVTANALFFTLFAKKPADTKAVTKTASSVAAKGTLSSAPASAIPNLGIAIRNYRAAEDTLFTYLGAPLTPEARPCGKNIKDNLECPKISLHTWTDVSEINRPAILTMSTPEKFSTYLVLIGLNTDNALVLNEQHEQVAIPLTKIGRDWTGEVVYLWKRPPGFTETVLLGDSSPTVAWLAQQFAKIDNQKDPLTDDLFSLALQERIKIFQRSKNLTVDGNINEETLMKVNEVIGADKTLLSDFKATTNKDSIKNVTTP